MLRVSPLAPSSPAEPIPAEHTRAVLYVVALAASAEQGLTLRVLQKQLSGPAYGSMSAEQVRAAVKQLLAEGALTEQAGRLAINERPESVAAPPKSPPSERPRPLAPDLVALGFTSSNVSSAGPMEMEERSMAELLMYIVDSRGMYEVDPADALLHYAEVWLSLLVSLFNAEVEYIDYESRLYDIQRKIAAARELHRRQRTALLDALAAAGGAR